jgi:mannose/cellobiose epimerase-like protein (N-acyl-D-glucosamine 2-epimerase family)
MRNHFIALLLIALQFFAIPVAKAQPAEAKTLHDEIVADLKNSTLSFWVKHSVDPAGGFYGSLRRDGTPIPDAPKGGVLNARILWTFSRAYRLYGDKTYRELADRAQRYLIDYLIDPQYGGVYWLVNADGTPLDTDKQTYACSYAIYGLAEHYRATGNPESLQKAIEIYQTMETKIKDPVKDGYIESFSREWGKPEKLGYDGDGVATKTMNTHIHVLEAYSLFYQVWKDPGLRERLATVLDILTTKLYNPKTHHLILFCDSDWNNLDDIDSYGHDIETSWLFTEAADALGDAKMIKRCRKIAVDMVDTALKEGLNSMGAMTYERHKDKYRRDASWWCQAETVNGCINAWQLTGKQHYLDTAIRTWEFIKNYMIDKEYGEWFRTVLPDGKPRYQEPKASLWNCPYHNSRMGFEIDTRLSSALPFSAGTEVMAWSNITGVRVDGELIDFESSLRVGTPKGDMEITGKERQVRPRYHREGDTQEVTTTLRGVKFLQKVTDKDRGLVEISIDAASDTTLNQGAYFCLTLAPEHYADARIKTGGKSLTITSATRKLDFRFNQSVKATVEKGAESTLVYLQLMPSLKKAAKNLLTMELRASGAIDHSDVNIALDVQNPGQLFTGFGGNFRLQNPNADPKVIDYCLENLRVAYGRVEMPWRIWEAEVGQNPLTAPKSVALQQHVEESMLMAKRLRAMGMPVILSCWFPPAWAIDGGPESYVRQGGIMAYRLDPKKKQQIFKSLSDYMIYAKRHYGVEFSMFSFNESDIGIDVLHSPQEHADFIKEFGAYMAKLNLPTRLLLGDNSDATTFDFILPGLNDPAAHKYIGAVSFHSWRGCDDATLKKWAAAARQLNVPLLIGEGSTDAAAHGYAEIFNESTFALYEINLYMRICAICQPLSILQWQLTSDYSLLWGDGIYGSKGPLHPTQRFWNMKQLASTPADALAIPLTSSKKTVNCAAFGNITRGEYALHMVNNGADCDALITGIPAGVKQLTVYTTNTKDSMRETTVTVDGGQARVHLPAISYVTLLSGD